MNTVLFISAFSHFECECLRPFNETVAFKERKLQLHIQSGSSGIINKGNA